MVGHSKLPHQIKVIYSLIVSSTSYVPIFRIENQLSFFFNGQSDTDNHLPCESPTFVDETFVINIRSKL